MALNYKKKQLHKSPVQILLEFLNLRDNENLEFQYSIYVNGEPGTGRTEQRQINKFEDINRFNLDIKVLIQNLKIDEELAIHSRIKKNGNVFHIPMIDFSCQDDKGLFNSMSKIQEEFNYDIYIFESGRSYHGYVDALLTEDQWHSFLGSLLLLNNDKIQITDTRWIGHSLRQDFSSLRLSCNTLVYITYPTFWRKIPKHNIEIN